MGVSSGPAVAASTGPVTVTASTAPAAAVTSSATAVSGTSSDFDQGPWVVGDVSVEGNLNVRTGAIRNQVRAGKGELYRRPDVNHDIQQVLGLGSFSRVTIDVEPIPGSTVPAAYQSVSVSSNTVRLVVKVVEKPVLKTITFEGTHEIGKGTLLDAISLKEKDPFDEFKLREDVDKVLAKYREKGYVDAKVETRQKDAGKGRIELIFAVSEGRQAKVGEVKVIGASAFPEKKIVKQMTNRPKKPFVAAEFEKDLTTVEKFYKTRGFIDYKLIRSTAVFEEPPAASKKAAKERRVVITLEISEGRAYKFGATTFSGSSLFNEEELKAAIAYREGRAFDDERFKETIQFIQEKYADHGRLKARVEPIKTPNDKTGELDVEFKIVEGPVIYVDHIDIEGAHSTKSYVFKREVVQKEGQPFNAAKIKRSREKIMNLGFIDNVDLDILQVPNEPEKVDLTFSVLEGKPGMLTAGAGFSSLDGLVGTISLQHRNLFGRAQQASIQWQFGSRVADYSVSWTTPWIYDKPTSLGVDVFNTRRLRPFQTSFSAFSDRRAGGRVRLGPRFEDDKYQMNFSFTHENVTIDNVDPAFVGTLTPGTSVTTSISMEFARDTRDSYWDPTSGTRNSIGYTLAGGPLGGDLNYYSPSLSDSWHHKLFSVGDTPFTLSFFNRLAYVDRFGSTSDVPVFQRFFIGGQDTLRGYSANGQVGDPSGSKVYDVFNTELKFPLAQEHRRTIVAGVFFFDMGGAWDNFRDLSLNIGPSTNDLKTDIGFGIRFTTPVFPIRLDWGYGLNHRPGESKFQVNFALGNLF